MYETDHGLFVSNHVDAEVSNTRLVLEMVRAAKICRFPDKKAGFGANIKNKPGF